MFLGLRAGRVSALLLSAGLLSLRAASPVDEFARDLTSSQPVVRRQAAVALGRAKDVAAVPALLQALKDPQADVRREAARALGLLKDARATAALVAALGDAEVNVRVCAAYALGEIRQPETTEPLLKALRDADYGVRDQAAWALAGMHDAKILPRVAALLKEADADAMHTVWLLKELDAKGAVAALAALLQEKDTQVKLRAVEALGSLKSPEATHAAEAALKDADATVRQAAMQLVGTTGGAEGRKRLRDLAATETDPKAREAALKLAQAGVKSLAPMGWWSFDDRNGKVAKDVTGRGSNGEIKGCTVVEGKIGAALRFGKGKYIELNKPTAFNLPNHPFTVMAWVKTDAKTGVIVARGGAANGYSLYIKDGLPKFGCRGGSGPLYLAAGKQPISGDWTHLAGIIDKDQVSLFVNGKLAGTAKSNGYVTGTGGQGMEIGFDVGNSAAEISDALEGIIDEVKVFTAALTEEEIALECAKK